MKHLFLRIRTVAAIALASAALVACGGGGSSSPPPPPPPVPATTGTLSVAMTNRHACDVEAVNVTVTHFQVTKAQFSSELPVYGMEDVPVSSARKVNIANLTNGELAVLGQATLDAGHYRLMTLVVSTDSMANTIVPSAGDAEQALEVQESLHSGIPVFADFDVTAAQKTDIVFDVDVCGLVFTSADGKRVLIPQLLPAVPSAPNGITGVVSPDVLASHGFVTAQQGGKIVASTKPDPATGEFWLSHLEPGHYDVVITADNSAASAIGAVPVAKTATTAISTRASPIELAPSSKMGSISGTLTYRTWGSGAQIEMSARQQIAPGQYVTVQSGRSEVTNTFSLANLPLAALQYAQYTSTLPLAFTASSIATPGKYTVVGSAWTINNVGFTDADISSGDQTGVNVVVTAPSL